MTENAKYLSALESVIQNNIDYTPLRGASILVTGSTGLVGKALVDYLLLLDERFSLGVRIYAASRTRESFEARFTQSERLLFFRYNTEESINSGVQFDFIIHAAGNADPKSFANDCVGTMTANFIGADNLLRYAKNNNVKRLLFVSSGEVYGQWDGTCEAFDESYCGRVDFTEPRGCYPSGKRATENLVVCYREQYGVDGVIVRLSHTYGPTQLERDSRAMSEFFARAAKGESIVLKSEGLPVRSYTCVFDCVSAIVTVLLRGESGEAYNIANPKSTLSIAELAKCIAACAEVEVVFDIAPGGIKGAGNIIRGVLRSEKLERLGWVPVYDIERGVRVTLDILRENKMD